MLARQTSDGKTAAVAALLADPASYGGSGANQPYSLELGTTAISPGDMSTFTPATFNGSLPLETEAGWANGVDALTAQPTLTLLPPEGGWRWEVGGGNVGLPETIRSFAIKNVDTDTYLACGNLDAPQTVNGEGQQINLPPVQVIPFV